MNRADDRFRHYLYVAGKTDNEIAEAIGTTRRAITKWRATRGLQPNRVIREIPPNTTATPMTAADVAWRDDAACIDFYDLFFPESTAGGDPYAEARIICGFCPVTTQCLNDALATESRDGQRHGMRSKLTPDERRKLARKTSQTQ